MSNRLPRHQLDPVGATDGDTYVYNPGTDEMEFAQPIPVGGATGNTLAKVSATDRDAIWISGSVPVLLLPAGSDASGVPPGAPAGSIILVRAT